MRKEALERVQDSARTILDHLDATTRDFYARLFDVAPDTRALFRNDMDTQRQHFAAALAVVLKNCEMMDALAEPLADLGAGHAAVGVRPEHYPLVRDAMLFAMARTLGNRWDDVLEADWTTLLDGVAHAMMIGGTRSATNDGSRPP